jgi:hypothetical protein
MLNCYNCLLTCECLSTYECLPVEYESILCLLNLNALLAEVDECLIIKYRCMNDHMRCAMLYRSKHAIGMSFYDFA